MKPKSGHIVSLAIVLTVIVFVAFDSWDVVFKSLFSSFVPKDEQSTHADVDNNPDQSSNSAINSLESVKNNYLDVAALSKINDVNLIDQINGNISWMLNKHASNCVAPWPDAVNCIVWFDSPLDNKRYLLTNSVPIYFVEPYCPFGVGDGYCFDGEDHKGCKQFGNKTCPSQAHRENTTGDVLVASVNLYGIDLESDPLNDSLPLGIHARDPFIWYYKNDSSRIRNNNNNNNNNMFYENEDEHEDENDFSYLFEYSSIDELESKINDLKNMDNYQNQRIGVNSDSNSNLQANRYANFVVIALHVTGQHIKGPDEAEGENVDYVGLELES